MVLRSGFLVLLLDVGFGRYESEGGIHVLYLDLVPVVLLVVLVRGRLDRLQRIKDFAILDRVIVAQIMIGGIGLQLASRTEIG